MPAPFGQVTDVLAKIYSLSAHFISFEEKLGMILNKDWKCSSIRLVQCEASMCSPSPCEINGRAPFAFACP